MCGRFARYATDEELIEAMQGALPDLDVADYPPLLRSFNVAPSQQVLAVGRSAPDHPHKFALLSWGFRPSYTKEFNGPAPINARAETIASKPMFRSAFERKRCLVLANGFFEWQRKGESKIPFYFFQPGSRPFAFGGLYDVCTVNGRQYSTCAIITTQANEVVQPIHDRMPVILQPEDYALWCDPTKGGQEVTHLMRPLPKEQLQSHAVGYRVNSPHNDDADLILKVNML